MIRRMILVAVSSAVLGVAGSHFAQTLGQSSAAPAAPPQADSARLDGNTRFAGTTVETITAAVGQELGLGFNTRGVVVRDVEGGSPADRMGLRAGDIVLNLNGRDIVTAADFRSIADARPESWQIVLQRGGRVFRSFVSG